MTQIGQMNADNLFISLYICGHLPNLCHLRAILLFHLATRFHLFPRGDNG